MRILSLGRRIVHGVAYSADGRFLISLNSGNQVRFWELPGGEPRLAFALVNPMWLPWTSPADRSGGFETHGRLLFLRNSAFDYGVYDLQPAFEYAAKTNKSPPESLVRRVSLEMTPRTPILGIAANESNIVGTLNPSRRRVSIVGWDLTGRRRLELGLPNARVRSHRLALSSDGRILAMTSTAPNVTLLTLDPVAELGKLAHTDLIKHLRFSPDGRLLATAAGRSVWLWDVESRAPLRRFSAFGRYATSLAFSPDGRLLAAGSRDGEVRLWDTASLREVTRLAWRIGEVLGLAFSPDGQTAAAAGRQGKIVVWDLD